MRIKIGARHSDLARLQAYTVGEALLKQMPGTQVEYSFKASLGDKNLTDPLWKMPEKGVFTEDFLQDLRAGAVDIVVHSWKDLPTEERSDTMIAATLPRADMRDILFVRKDRLANIKGRMRVYSSSPRRAHNLGSFLTEHLPLPINEVEFVSVRGNVPTRFRKFMADDIDGFVMAKAAIDRLLASHQEEFREVRSFLREQIDKCLWVVLPIKVNPPAAAQGALAIEVLKSRTDLLKILESINHQETFHSVNEERRVLKSYGGGCHQKIGVAVMARSYGQIFSLQGLTDRGESLNQWTLKGESGWKFTRSELWPIEIENRIQFEREKFNIDESQLKGKALWVAKSEAMPENVKPNPEQLIWTSGLETWKKLTKRGFWVNGSVEGLGELEATRVESLAPKTKWLKLSHTEAGDVSTLPMLATYRLLTPKVPKDLQGKKCFYWSSGSALEAALHAYPEIKQAHHASGPGNTYQILRKLIGDDSRVRVFLNHEDWLKQSQTGVL